jgi:hypothetical protein
MSMPSLQSSSSVSVPTFLTYGLSDFVRHPGRRALGLVHLHPLDCEYVQLFRASLEEFDVRVASVGCLEGRF